MPFGPALGIDPLGRRAIEGELERTLLKGSGQGPNQFRQGAGR